MHDSHGLHHHLQKKIIGRPSLFRRVVDKAVYFFGILAQVMTLDQLYRVWILKNASGVSPFAWGAFALLAFFWVAYGFIHKTKPLIYIYSVWFVLQVLVVIGTLLYG